MSILIPAIFVLSIGYGIVSNIVKIVLNDEISVKKGDQVVYKNRLPWVRFAQIDNVVVREISDSESSSTYNVSLKGEKNIVIGKGINWEEGNHLAELLALYMDKNVVKK